MIPTARSTRPSPAEVRDVLRRTADRIFDGDDEDYGGSVRPTQREYLRVNAHAAVEAVRDFFGAAASTAGQAPAGPRPTDSFSVK